MSLIDLNNQVWSQDSDTELGDTPAAGGSAALKGDWTGGLTLPSRSRSEDIVCISAVKRSIGFTIGFHNHGEGPY